MQKSEKNKVAPAREQTPRRELEGGGKESDDNDGDGEALRGIRQDSPRDARGIYYLLSGGASERVRDDRGGGTIVVARMRPERSGGKRGPTCSPPHIWRVSGDAPYGMMGRMALQLLLVPSSLPAPLSLYSRPPSPALLRLLCSTSYSTYGCLPATATGLDSVPTELSSSTEREADRGSHALPDTT